MYFAPYSLTLCVFSISFTSIRHSDVHQPGPDSDVAPAIDTSVVSLLNASTANQHEKHMTNSVSPVVSVPPWFKDSQSDPLKTERYKSHANSRSFKRFPVTHDLPVRLAGTLKL